MNNTLKWAVLESMMIAIIQLMGLLRPKFIRFINNRISKLEYSY